MKKSPWPVYLPRRDDRHLGPFPVHQPPEDTMPTATAKSPKRTRRTLKLPSQPQPETPPPCWNKPAPAYAGGWNDGDILNDPLPDDAPVADPQAPPPRPLPPACAGAGSLYDTIHAKALIDPGFAIAWALLEINDAMHDIAAEVRALADQQRRHWDDGK